jgi:hypothetical protein
MELPGAVYGEVVEGSENLDQFVTAIHLAFGMGYEAQLRFGGISHDRSPELRDKRL